ncbi:hypothetical protein L804_05084 [Cryptococcus deuterogattii 2001/935-1]|nr:hypothetical protein L804_05084 [Cryptococcus deuterogattii 2001/935-1]
MPSLFQSPSKMSLKDVKAPFKKRRPSASFISPPIPVSSLPSDPPANHGDSKVNGDNQGWKDGGTWEKPSEIIKLGPAFPPPLPPKSPSPPPVPPKSPPLSFSLPSQSQLRPQPSSSPEKSLPKSPTRNFIIKMVAKSVSMSSLHSAANLRGNENALRRMHPIEETEAKGKGHVKNNGRAKYKDKNTKASKPPAGSKGYHRWKKEETTKPTPKSQEKEKSPKRGILKFSKKEANPTLNSYSESEIMGKKKSKGKAMQEVPRKVRFHHVSPTRPVSGSSNDSSYTKRSRGGNATVSAAVDSMLDQMLTAQANYTPASPIAFPTAIPTPLEGANEVSSCPYPVSEFGAGYGSASSFPSAEGFTNPSLSISDRLGIETEGINRGVSSMENTPKALDGAIPDSAMNQGMPVISVELIDDEVHSGNSYPHLASEVVIPSFTNPLRSTRTNSKKNNPQTILSSTHSNSITPWYDVYVHHNEPASPALSAVSASAVIGARPPAPPSHLSPYHCSRGHLLSVENGNDSREKFSSIFEPISKTDNPKRSELMVDFDIGRPYDEALARASSGTTAIATRANGNASTKTKMSSIPSLPSRNHLKQPHNENSSTFTPVISPSMSESIAEEILLTPMDHCLRGHSLHSMTKISRSGEGVNGGIPGDLLTVEQSLMYRALFTRAFQRGFLTADDLKGEKIHIEALIPGGHWSKVDHGVAKEMVNLRRENARLKLAVSEDIVESQRAELSAFLNSPPSSYSQDPCSPYSSPSNSPSRNQGLKITTDSPNITPRRLRYINSNLASSPTSRNAKYNNRRSPGVDYLINEVCQLRTELEVTRDRQEQWQHRAELAETHRERAEESVAAMQAMFGRVMEDLDEARRRSQMTRTENEKARLEMEDKRLKGEMTKLELRRRSDKDLLEKEKMKVKVKIMEKKIEGYNEAVRMFKHCLVEVAQLREQRSGLEQELFHLRTDYDHLSLSTTASVNPPSAHSPASFPETKGHPHSQVQHSRRPSSSNISTYEEDGKEKGSLTPVGLTTSKPSQSLQPSTGVSKTSVGQSRPSFWKFPLTSRTQDTP